MLDKPDEQTAVRLSQEDRRRSERHMYWRDHGVLRTIWTNFDAVAPGVYRSNYPSHARLEHYRDLGIKALFTLRGQSSNHHYVLEADSCRQLGLSLHALALSARKAPPKDLLRQVFEIFDVIPRPFLIHCKSGADRAGLVSALYLLDQGATIEQARAQLSLRYLHLRFTKTGIQDHLLDVFAERLENGPINIRDWVAKEYDPESLETSFDKIRMLPI